MSEEQRLAWEKKYSRQGAVWARSHDDWFENCDADLVLDIGCGTGKSCSSLRGKIVGADFSMVALRMLRDSMPNISAICCDATMLPFQDSSFDFVRASFVLGHLNGGERQSVISDISRVLRSGGTLALEVFSTGDARFLRKGESPRDESIGDDGILHFYFSESDVKELLSCFKKTYISESVWEQRIGPKETMKRSSIRAVATKG
jgi:ubiquinone/menaquinone biosynthesis C-methylase UbiE